MLMMRGGRKAQKSAEVFALRSPYVSFHLFTDGGADGRQPLSFLFHLFFFFSSLSQSLERQGGEVDFELRLVEQN